MFKAISEAYSVLSNPSRRQRYDLYGETKEDEGMDDFFSGMDDFFKEFGGGGFDDFDNFINILE